MKKQAMIVLIIWICAHTFTHGQTAVEAKNILAHGDWGKIYKEYRCNPEHLQQLKQRIIKLVTVEVYFAFWCIDSEENVPTFLKIIETIDSPNIKVKYFTVERKPSQATLYYVEKLKVERIPTFIFFMDGKEIGRIVEQPAVDLAEDMMQIF